MKNNYIIICLDSMFEAFCVADEFIFVQFWDVFEIGMYMSKLFGTEITIWVSEGCLEVWAVNCICHISICNVSRSIHIPCEQSLTYNKSMLYHGNRWQRTIALASSSCSHHFPVAICVHVIWVFSRLWRVPAKRPDPNFYFATRTRPELLLKSSEFRVFPNRLFPSRLLQIF